MTQQELAKYFDHTYLKPVGTEKNIKELCEEAKKYGFASVCIRPCDVVLAKNLLRETKIKVCTVVGFPLGVNTTKTKVKEARQAAKSGADEIDMVINRGDLKAKKDDYVENEIRQIVKTVNKKIVKVIIECSDLTDEEKARACKIAKKAGADFVKTSTGFGKSGATVHDVKLMKKAFDNGNVKAAGGIKKLDDALAMIKAGATRIGASKSNKIIEEFKYRATKLFTG